MDLLAGAQLVLIGYGVASLRSARIAMSSRGGSAEKASVVERSRAENQLIGGVLCAVGFQALVQIGGGMEDVAVARFPKLADVLENLHQARMAVAAVGRKIGSAVERFEIGCEKNIERPAALSAHRLDEGHVNLVHIRSFLAVELDADEVLVEEMGDPFVLEGFPFHDVAPVAGRVTYAEEDRLVLPARPREGFLAPGKPVHRIVGVLEEVR